MFASNECSVDLKAIYHLGCMFWMCLAHPWNDLRRCTLKYYDTFIQGYKNGTLWSNSGSARYKNNCIIIIKGWFCCTWTQMNLTTVFTLSYLFISLPAKYIITSLKQGLSLSSEWKHEHIQISFESDLRFWVQRFKSIMQKNAKKNTLISAFRWFATQFYIIIAFMLNWNLVQLHFIVFLSL